MRKEIHPEYVDCAIVCTCGNTIQTRSTKKEIHTEICSACHPFFSGKQKMMDTAGRVERFQKRYGNWKEKAAKQKEMTTAKNKERDDSLADSDAQAEQDAKATQVVKAKQEVKGERQKGKSPAHAKTAPAEQPAVAVVEAVAPVAPVADEPSAPSTQPDQAQASDKPSDETAPAQQPVAADEPSAPSTQPDQAADESSDSDTKVD